MVVIRNRFPDKVITNHNANPLDIIKWEYWTDVIMIISGDKQGEDLLEIIENEVLWKDDIIWAESDIEDKVILIIDDVVWLWIEDYKKLYFESWDFLSETEDIW